MGTLHKLDDPTQDKRYELVTLAKLKEPTEQAIEKCGQCP